MCAGDAEPLRPAAAHAAPAARPAGGHRAGATARGRAGAAPRPEPVARADAARLRRRVRAAGGRGPALAAFAEPAHAAGDRRRAGPGRRLAGARLAVVACGRRRGLRADARRLSAAARLRRGRCEALRPDRPCVRLAAGADGVDAGRLLQRDSRPGAAAERPGGAPQRDAVRPRPDPGGAARAAALAAQAATHGGCATRYLRWILAFLILVELAAIGRNAAGVPSIHAQMGAAHQATAQSRAP